MISTTLMARQLELGFPNLTHRIKVFLPENHNPTKKYPTLFFYHGAGGKPDTSLMQFYTRDRDWIIVGMSYYQSGAVTFNMDTLAEQKHLFGSVKNHLKTKYGLDPTRCYVAGFSKGGWLSDMLLQLDSSLAGAVILGAGHLDQVKKSPQKYRKNKPVFIGIGRKDPNFPFALQAIMFHRGLGAATTFESWPNLGHTLPEEGSHALYQWLALQVKSPDTLRISAKEEMQKALEGAMKLPTLPRWDRLQQLRQLPYTKILGKTWTGQIDTQLVALEKTPQIQREKTARADHRKLLRQEIKKNSLENILQVHAAYLTLAEKYPNTRQAKLAKHDYERTAIRIRQFSKQKSPDTTPAVKKSDPPIKPKKIDLPTNRRRVPSNPLIR